MDLIEEYRWFREHSKDYPICSSELAKAFGVPRTTIGRMINTARSNGSPICSGQMGYYITTDKEEIKNTIQSLRGRISKMEKAITGLETCLQGCDMEVIISKAIVSIAICGVTGYVAKLTKNANCLWALWFVLFIW